MLSKYQHEYQISLCNKVKAMNYVSALDIVLFHSMLIACSPLLASEYIQIILLCKIQVFQFNGKFLWIRLKYLFSLSRKAGDCLHKFILQKKTHPCCLNICVFYSRKRFVLT